jgi:hypothetical protein
VPDWPWCRNADSGLRKLTTGRNADDGLTFFRHLILIFQNHIARIKLSAAVYKCAGCTTFHYLQLRRVSLSPPPTPAVPMDVQGVSLSSTYSLDVQWISLSPPPTPAVWTCKVYDFPLSAI